jgi:hypothetical protein
MVDRGHLADHELGAAKHAPEWHDHRARVDQPARDLGKERLVQHEVLGVHERDPVVGAEEALEATRRVHPDVAAADDQDPRAHMSIVGVAPASRPSVEPALIDGRVVAR